MRMEVFNDSLETEYSNVTYGERVFVATLVLAISVIGTIGNSVVILAVILSKQLQNTPNAFVVSLATADLCYCLLLPLSNAVALLARNGWPWDTEWPCIFSAVMSFTCAGASLYNLACIALNRLLMVRGPVSVHEWLFTPWKNACMVTLTWGIPLSAVLIPPSFGIGDIGYDPQDNTCSDIDNHPNYMQYHLVQVFCNYPVPLFTIIISYTMVFLHVRKHFKNHKESFRASHNMDSEDAAVDSTSRELEDRFTKRVDKQQMKITKNLFIVSCTFLLCSAPYSIALLWTGSSRVLVLLSVLFTFNSCVNPIIYTINHPRFNRIIRLILRCKLADIPDPSKVLKAVLREPR